MSELSAETRALLDAARSGLGPDAAAVMRMRAGVAARVGSGALATLGAKLGLVTLVAAIGIGTFVYAHREPAPVAPPSEPDVAPMPVRVAPAVAVHVAPAVGSAPAVPSLADVDPEIEIDPPVVAIRPARVSREVVADLDREVALIDRATTALRAGEALRAITTIKLYETETSGHGQLAEEAAAVDVEATCTARVVGGAHKLATFTARFPRSAQLAHLRTTCK